MNDFDDLNFHAEAKLLAQKQGPERHDDREGSSPACQGLEG